MKRNIKKEAEALMPTDWGEFRMMAFSSKAGQYSPNIVMVHPDMDPLSPITIRMHSECLTGDLFHSRRCDCGNQLHSAMERIAEDRGILFYLRQEGRGIGIVNKLKAYNKQDEGFDTIEANKVLGLTVDGRTYDHVIDILEYLGVSQIRLLTNNPLKIKAFDRGPISLVDRIPLEIPPHERNSSYLSTKKNSMGHLLTLSA